MHHLNCFDSFEKTITKENFSHGKQIRYKYGKRRTFSFFRKQLCSFNYMRILISRTIMTLGCVKLG